MPENTTSISNTSKTIQTVLGFDFGAKRIGVASGQVITGTASAIDTLTNVKNQPDWEKIEKLIADWKPDALVVGLPYLLDGQETEMTIRADKFARRLHGRFGLPVFTISETLSSFEAEEQIKQNKKLSGKNKHEVDKLAAALITETWLQENQ